VHTINVFSGNVINVKEIKVCGVGHLCNWHFGPHVLSSCADILHRI